MTEKAISLQDVSKRIGNKTILHPLSLTVNKGASLCLCGGNGAGKSTLIRLITGTTKPSSGTIAVFGRKLDDKHTPTQPMLGYMPDYLNFPKNLTALELLHFYGKLRSVKRARIEAVLEEVGLSPFAHQKVGGFSKGMQQRLLFAQAVLSQPPLLVMDEPTNGLDPGWVMTFERLVRELQQQGTTIVFSTHDMHVIERTADHVVMLDQGQILLAETTKGLLRVYGTVENAFFSRVSAASRSQEGPKTDIEQ
jgi:ABC-type multidrug transport system ATPase subunit